MSCVSRKLPDTLPTRFRRPSASPRPLCGCYAEGYAAGKNKAYFEMLASLDGPPHAEGFGWQPCQVKRACLRKVMTLMARSSPRVFALVETWALENHDDWH